MTILCATHFSPGSLQAAHVAGVLARRTRQRVVLLTVLPTQHLGSSEDDARKARASLRQQVDFVRKAGHIEVEAQLVYGDFDTAVARACVSTSAQLLVVGATDASSADALGPLLHQLRLPLLLVRNIVPFDVWNEHGRPLRLLIAVDRTTSTSASLDWLTRLADYGALDVVAVYVWSSAEADDALELTLTDEFRRSLTVLPANVTRRVRLVREAQPTVVSLNAIALQEGVDLVVLGLHLERSKAGDAFAVVSRDFLSNLPMSVAFVPAGVGRFQEPLQRAFSRQNGTANSSR